MLHENVFDGEHLYVTVKDSGMADLEELNRLDGVSGTELNRNILSVTIQEDFWRMLQWQKISDSWRRIS